ncbi:MAG: hypothetical protein QG623_49 [Patescibacteria group bacterium]|nr:hypothetical protein [Patescibacteria group bacterium]
MQLLDLELKIVIENPVGTYKKFVDSLNDYPILGVTFPTHYGYINGYFSEDNHDLDVFLGSGSEHGILQVKRDDVPGGIETKIILFATKDEYDSIQKEYDPVISEIKRLPEEELVEALKNFTQRRSMPT